MDQVRLGVIGCGGMGRSHMTYFSKVAGLKFTAASDVVPSVVDQVVKQYGVKGFADGNQLIKSGEVDAVLIATPHYFHPPFAMAAMQQGLHVLSEKPQAVTAKAAAEVNAFHKKHPKSVYAIMFQSRTTALWKKLKQLIDAGEIGAMSRVTWICTDWFRTQAYYDSGGWRATWGGEGGGVLINQCPHNLDLFTWFLGLPNLVSARVGLGKFHKIEVEDDVTAYFEFANGATGVFITSTGESPGTNRLEISGDLGKLTTTGGTIIELYKTDLPVSQFNKTSRESFSRPPQSKMTIEVPNKGGNHQEITQNFVNAILHGEPLIAPGEEGLKGLELGNAILMSGLTGKPIPIPTPRDAYDKLLRKLAKTSKFKKTVKEAKADMAASFHA